MLNKMYFFVESGGSTDMKKVLDAVIKHYYEFNYELLQDTSSARINSQVLLWNVPKSFKGDKEQFEWDFGNFTRDFPGRLPSYNRFIHDLIHIC